MQAMMTFETKAFLTHGRIQYRLEQLLASDFYPGLNENHDLEV